MKVNVFRQAVEKSADSHCDVVAVQRPDEFQIRKQTLDEFMNLVEIRNTRRIRRKR